MESSASRKGRRSNRVSAVLRRAVLRGVAIAAILLSLPLGWRVGAFLGGSDKPPEMFLDIR